MDFPDGPGAAGELLTRRLVTATGALSRPEEQLRAQERELELIWREGVLSVELPHALPDFTGSEHEIWGNGRDVLKATLPGGYGRLWGARRFATPAEYLDRMTLLQACFAQKWQIVGLAREMGRTRLVSRQPFLLGTRPSLPEVAHYMQGLGFVFQRHRFGNHWVRSHDGVIAYDAEPANFVKTAAGLIPVDLILQRIL